MPNLKIAQQSGIYNETVNNNFSFIATRGLSLNELQKLDDPEL